MDNPYLTNNHVNRNNIIARIDGSIEINGDANDRDSMNFNYMMANILLNSNIVRNLDMKFSKEKISTSNFKVIYGNFPLINHPENKLDIATFSTINNQASTYNPNIDYKELLSKNLPEVSTSFDIISKHVMNKEGSFQMGIKNGPNSKHDMLFYMDGNYNNISESFRESGALVSMDTSENNIVRVNNNMLGEQLLVLNSTLGNLNQKELNNANTELNKDFQFVKKYEDPIDNEAANVSQFLLITTICIEIVFIGLYFIFLFNK